jgi:preprotein translocase subunit SecG
MVKIMLKKGWENVMSFYIGVLAVIFFFCWVLYFLHTVEYGKSRRRNKKRTHIRFHRD